jgi:hypothetical protein
MQEKYVTVTIDPKGQSMKVEADGFQGQGCGAMMEAFDSMGNVTEEIQKPEFFENQNQNVLHAGRG